MTVAGIQIEIERKKIKHTHLAVYPPDARVHVSAPEELDERDIRSYVAVHELTHFEVANHSKTFVELMDKRLPHWRALRDELNAFIGMPLEERP